MTMRSLFFSCKACICLLTKPIEPVLGKAMEWFSLRCPLLKTLLFCLYMGGSHWLNYFKELSIFQFTYYPKYAILNLITLWHSAAGNHTYSKEYGLSTRHLGLAVTRFCCCKAYSRYALNRLRFE